MVRTESLELEKSIEHIWQIAHESGLDPFSVHFSLVPSHIMYELGAYGLPGRFSHWTHGKAYHQMKTVYDYGLSKIYELVINTDPAYAFLMEGNKLVQNKLTAAHVLGHVDFFKHNVSFQDTNRQMAETANVNADRISRYEFEHGIQEVEGILDSALTIELDIDKIDLKRPTPTQYLAQSQKQYLDDQKSKKRPQSDYDDLFELGVKKPLEEKKLKAPFPYKEEDDLLWFISAFSPEVDEWKKDIIDIVRYESQYFLPQRKTRNMNEGWASLWHSRIIRNMDNRNLLKAGEYEEFAKLHSSILAPSRRTLNPYYVGLKLFEDIDRKSKGLPHPKGKKEKNWLGEEIDPQTYKGKLIFDIFWVRENVPSDQAFFRDYLTDDLIEELDLFVYHLEGTEWKIVEKDPQKVKAKLLGEMNNFGKPLVTVAIGGGDYKGNRELYLKHIFDEYEIDIDWAGKTLRHIHSLWGRPVHLETIIDGQSNLLSFDGTTDIQKKKL